MNLRKEMFAEVRNWLVSGETKTVFLIVKNYSETKFELTVNKLFKIAEILDVNVSQILNFDASQIFNVKDYGVANVDIHSQTNNYSDPYKHKYIQLLEAEVARLKKLEEK